MTDHIWYPARGWWIKWVVAAVIMFVAVLGLVRACDAWEQPPPPPPVQANDYQHIRTMGHFMFAAAAGFTVVAVCSKVADHWFPQHPTVIRVGCGAATELGIGLIAATEYHRYKDFDRDDYYADMAGGAVGGTGGSLITLHW